MSEMKLSTDAMTFGFCYLNGSKRTLSFGGDGAQMKITARARAALNELLESGYAVTNEPTDSIPNREHYRGVDQEAHLGELLKETGINPFGDELRWVMFEKI